VQLVRAVWRCAIRSWVVQGHSELNEPGKTKSAGRSRDGDDGTRFYRSAVFGTGREVLADQEREDGAFAGSQRPLIELPASATRGGLWFASQFLDRVFDLRGILGLGIELQILLQLVSRLFVLVRAHVDSTQILMSQG